MIGKSLGHFRILDRIGAGGMGEIYRAHDEHLDRDVALKVLPAGSATDAGARKRFRREALALAKLKHPHIGVVHDFGSQDGVDYLVMELIRGTDLSAMLSEGPLPEAEVVRLGIQIAEALEEAHEHQIVHRDLKPQNVMVTPKNQAKVLDFGLAMLVRPLHEASTASMTEAQTLAGTLPYMAPEQLREGAEIDARTDVYALGATLHEMATGQRAFPQTDHAKLITAILNDAPPSVRDIRPDLDEQLERVIVRALQKDPDKRYASAAEMRADLQRVQQGMPVPALPISAATRAKRLLTASAGAVALFALFVSFNVGGLRDRFFGGEQRIASIAVLPFANYSPGGDESHLADTMTDFLISKLGRIGLEKVTAHRSVRVYDDTDMSLAEIGAQLKVDAVIEGSLVLRGREMKLTARLMNPRSEQHLWTQEYDGDLEDWEGFANDVVLAVAAQIGLTLSPEMSQSLAQHRKVDPALLEVYAAGRAKLYTWNETLIREAIALFETAIGIDSTFALAYTGLAQGHAFLAAAGLEVEPWDVVGPKAQAAVERALELDDQLPEAYAVRAQIRHGYEWDIESAEKDVLRAIELNASYVEPRIWHAQHLNILGQHDEALAEIRRAQEIDPNDLFTRNNVIWCLMFVDLDQAVSEAQEYLADTEYWVLRWAAGLALYLKGSYGEAIETLEQALETYRRENRVQTEANDNSQILAILGRAYARSKQPDKALAIVERFEKSSPRAPAVLTGYVYADLENLDVAFQWLERAYAEHSSWLVWLHTILAPDNLRTDPRYEELVKRIGVRRS